MKKCFVLILSLVLITACKSPENPVTTLEDREGTYTGNGYTLIVNTSGEVQLIDDLKLSYKASFDKTSKETSFKIDNFTILFYANTVKINDKIELKKENNNGTILLTLAEKSGIYTGNQGIQIYNMVLQNNGKAAFTIGSTSAGESTIGNSISTSTSFTFDIGAYKNCSLIFNSDVKAILKMNSATVELTKN